MPLIFIQMYSVIQMTIEFRFSLLFLLPINFNVFDVFDKCKDK